MKNAKLKTKQLRLLLPEEWVPELDSLAASRFLTRLGLLRFYIKAGMTDDFSKLAEHFKQSKENKRAHQRLQSHLQDRER
jgi:hypothetical protein